MGSSSSRGNEEDFALPSQQVVCIQGAQALTAAQAAAATGQRGRVPEVVARHVMAAAPRQATQEFKVPLVWDKGSLCLERAGGRHQWQLKASFTAEVACDLEVCFHCSCSKEEGGVVAYQAVDAAAPPAVRASYPAGKHEIRLAGASAIDLQRWPLEVFWRYKARNPRVIPIVFSLSARGKNMQSVLHLGLEVPSRRLGKSSEVQLEYRILAQKVIIDGQEWQLEEIFGLAEMGKDSAHDESAHGEPCIVCLTEPRNTAVLPCRHLCVCEDCGGQLQAVRAQRQCPICRGAIEGLQIIEVRSKTG